jgi:serine/threonine-protein kinase
VLALHSFAAAKVAGSKQLSSKKLRSMARIFMTYGDYEKACGLAEKAYHTAVNIKAENGELALCMIDLGTVYSNLERFSEASQMLQEGVHLQKKALFDNHPYVAHTYRLLSDVQRRDGQLDTAEQTLAQAVNIMLTHCNLESNEMSPFILESAKLYSAKGEFVKAEENYQIALDMIEQSYGKQHLLTANVLESMAQCCLTQQKFERADTYISSAMAIQGKLFGRYNPVLVDSWLTKAKICRANGQTDRSEYYLDKAIASVEKSRNAITLARVYEQVNRIRNEKLYAAAVSLN